MPADPGPPESPRRSGVPALPGRGAPGGGALETVRALFWLLAMGTIVAFAFFALVGTVDLVEAWPATLVVVVLIVLWVVHAILERRHAEDARTDPRLRASRERRGF